MLLTPRADLARRPLGPLTAALAIAAAWGLGGCTGNLNQSNGLFGSELPDLAGRLPATLPANDSPSLNGLDRSAWEPTVIRLERRQVETNPSYASNVLYDRSTARERGEWPSTESSLEGGGSAYRATAESFSAPVFAAFDLVAMPVRFFFNCPCNVVRQPAAPASLSVVPTRAEPSQSPPAAPDAAASKSQAGQAEQAL
jgi:hypothetical protein